MDKSEKPEMVYLKPIEGVKVKRVGYELPASGALVEMDPFWVRRLSEGSVEIVEEKPSKEVKKQDGGKK